MNLSALAAACRLRDRYFSEGDGIIGNLASSLRLPKVLCSCVALKSTDILVVLKSVFITESPRFLGCLLCVEVVEPGYNIISKRIREARDTYEAMLGKIAVMF